MGGNMSTTKQELIYIRTTNKCRHKGLNDLTQIIAHLVKLLAATNKYITAFFLSILGQFYPKTHKKWNVSYSCDIVWNVH